MPHPPHMMETFLPVIPSQLKGRGIMSNSSSRLRERSLLKDKFSSGRKTRCSTPE
ncbi:hypothetical protein SESBI_04868 [Sesbania bispinosa]|nr:hypothetical protein SESBI_04868 [Sesbania bispinosa]